MVIDNFNVYRTVVGPTETQPPLVVDPDTVLIATITTQSLKTVPRGGTQVTQVRSGIEQRQLALGHCLDIRPSPGLACGEKALRISTAETSNHRF